MASPGKVVNSYQTTLIASSGGPNSYDNTYYTNGTDGLLVHELDDSPNGGCDTVFAPPVVELPPDIVVGQSIRGSTSFTCQGFLVQVDRSTQVLGFQTVQVPAGRYRALKLSATITTTSTSQDTHVSEQHTERDTIWLVAGIGEVKWREEYILSNGWQYQTADAVLTSTNLVADDDGRKDDGDDCGCSTGDSADGADGINYDTGNNYISDLDQVVANSPLKFQRSYNSRVPDSTEFGQNWRHNYSGSLLFAPGETAGTATVAMVRPSGKTYTFVQNGGAWVSDADVNAHLTVTLDTNGALAGATYVTPQSDTETYGATGQLQSIQYRTGTSVTLSYEAGGQQRLIAATDNFGHKLSFGYDSANRLQTMTGPDGQAVTYGYDTTNRLTTVTRQDGKTRQYQYNQGAYTGNTDLPYALTSLQDENGVVYAVWNYDASGRAISSEHPGGVQKKTIAYSAGNASTITDGLNQSRNVGYQKILGVSKNTSLSAACSNCSDGQTAAKTYDANGNVASRTDFNGNVTTYTYDLTRNLETQRVEAAGTAAARTITTEWHSTYRLPLRIAGPNKRSTFSYDASGNLLSKSEQGTSDANGNQGLSAPTVGTARTWSWTYNNVGQVLSATDPRSAVSNYAYDSTGNLISITNAAGQVTTLTNYDANGRAGRLTNPNGLVTDLTYSPRGWLTSKTVGGESTVYDYDGVGQLKHVTNPDTSWVSYTYDDAHRLTDLADSSGNRIHYTLDAMGNRIKEEVQDPTGALARQTTRIYDALNRLQQVTGGL